MLLDILDLNRVACHPTILDDELRSPLGSRRCQHRLSRTSDWWPFCMRRVGFGFHRLSNQDRFHMFPHPGNRGSPLSGCFRFGSREVLRRVRWSCGRFLSCISVVCPCLWRREVSAKLSAQETIAFGECWLANSSSIGLVSRRAAGTCSLAPRRERFVLRITASDFLPPVPFANQGMAPRSS